MSAVQHQLPTKEIPARQWGRAAEQHREQIDWCLQELFPHRDRPHPVYDFLFTYYSFPRSKLRQWHPGAGVKLLGKNAIAEFSPKNQRFYATDSEGAWLDPAAFPQNRMTGLKQTLGLIEATDHRPPMFGCYGLHEWAMVYKMPAEKIRHGNERLRLSEDEIRSFIEGSTICCSHWDAFRFFTKEAAPLNRLQPGPGNRLEMEQPACLHANMDLYRWSYKFSPWVSSHLVRETFFLAREIREIDMRASPYDLEGYGLTPIPIETVEGRAEYESYQRRFADQAAPLRKKLIAEMAWILEWLESA